jgi:sugar/nucleoside kinase (ribokinase family)
MAFGFLPEHDIVRACRYGNAMGAQRCAGSGLQIYLPRAETDAQIERTYSAGAGAARA